MTYKFTIYKMSLEIQGILGVKEGAAFVDQVRPSKYDSQCDVKIQALNSFTGGYD